MGLPWMSVEEMDRDGPRLYQAITKYVLPARLKLAGMRLSLEEIGGHRNPVPRAQVHIDDPPAHLVKDYARSTVTELIAALGGKNGPFNHPRSDRSDAGRFKLSRAMKILQQAIKHGVPLTRPDRSYAWADIPFMVRLQWFRWKELCFQLQDMMLQLANLDPPIEFGAVTLPYPDIGYRVTDTDMAVYVDLDPHTTLFSPDPKFRVVLLNLTAVSHRDVVIAVSDPLWNQVGLVQFLADVKITNLISEDEIKKALDHLVQALEAQKRSLVFSALTLPESHLTTYFAERWVAQREED